MFLLQWSNVSTFEVWGPEGIDFINANIVLTSDASGTSQQKAGTMEDHGHSDLTQVVPQVEGSGSGSNHQVFRPRLLVIHNSSEI